MSDAALPASKGKAATINDIARLSGVSKKTVSRIINNSPLVRKDTRDKVEALMREVGYVPDPLARGLAFRRSFLIGLVYDDPGAQCIVDLQHGALEALRGAIPAARSLSLLDAVARGTAAQLVLDYLAHSRLAVDVAPCLPSP